MHIIETINQHYVPRRSVLGGENIFTEISRLLERMVQVASTMEILARSVDKEEKFWIELIYSAHLLERISQVANTQVALLQQHLDKLPRTAEALKEHLESREVYAIRRIRWATMDCIQRNIYLERWLLIKKAGVARLAEQPQVKDAIDAAMQLFSGLS